jgi:hypothetical protein
MLKSRFYLELNKLVNSRLTNDSNQGKFRKIATKTKMQLLPSGRRGVAGGNATELLFNVHALFVREENNYMQISEDLALELVKDPNPQPAIKI